MINNNIVTLIVSFVFVATILSPFVKLLWIYFYRPKTITITSKSGETAVLNVEGENDVDMVIKFADILLGLK